ncbi:MAG: SH3 domain-containing protein [Clostridia bacterium]|nr:SH3 domain-containing protein [Clostridia bacterium]
MKRLLAWMIAAMLLATAGAAEGSLRDKESYVGFMEVVNCDAWVSLRAAPDVSSARLAQVPLGELVEDCVRFNDAFYYVSYGGQTGFILGEYLEAIEGDDEDLDDDIDPEGIGIGADGLEPGEAPEREAAIAVEGEQETITERYYASDMGYSLWYDSDLFEVVGGVSESGTGSFLLEGKINGQGIIATVECLSPEATGQRGDDYLKRIPAEYGVTVVGDSSGVTESGDTWRCVSGLLDDREMSFYTVTNGEQEAQLIATLSLELVEGFSPRIDHTVGSVSFAAE